MTPTSGRLVRNGVGPHVATVTWYSDVYGKLIDGGDMGVPEIVEPRLAYNYNSSDSCALRGNGDRGKVARTVPLR